MFPLSSAYLKFFTSRLELNPFLTTATYLSPSLLVARKTPLASATKLFFSVGERKRLFQDNISKAPLLMLWTTAATLEGHFFECFDVICFTFEINNMYIFEKYENK